MKYLGLYKPSAPEGTPPTTEDIARMGKLIDEMVQAGVLLSTEGCLPSAKGARVRYQNGKFTVTDGPFTEAKELIAGFALFRVKTREEAIYWTKRFLEAAGEGESEIRQIYEPDDFGEQFTPEQRAVEERQRAQMAANR
jgi:hypothetical protein